MYKRSKQLLPDAVAIINGTGAFAAVRGQMKLYQTPAGVIAEVSFDHLPHKQGLCERSIFGFHIHSGTACTGNTNDAYADAGMHYNPHTCPHPYHAGDLPPIFNANGRAYLKFLTDRFTVQEVLGKTVILHGKPDDFTTQPSGNAGKKIACGTITPVRR